MSNAEEGSHADMIEVPEISVCHISVGPVWFTSRADQTFSKYMSQWTDLPIVGALGGSSLHFFRVTADYPNRRVTFERPV
jgi:hypothetical protein